MFDNARRGFEFVSECWSAVAESLARAATAAGLLPRKSSPAECVADSRSYGFNQVSRTDRSVHSVGNVVTLQANATFPLETGSRYLPELVHRMNAALPPSIRVLSAVDMPRGFQSRSSCQARAYDYYIPLAALAPDAGEEVQRQAAELSKSEAVGVPPEAEEGTAFPPLGRRRRFSPSPAMAQALDRFRSALRQLVGHQGYQNFTVQKVRSKHVQWRGDPSLYPDVETAARITEARLRELDPEGTMWGRWDPHDDFLALSDDVFAGSVDQWSTGEFVRRSLFQMECSDPFVFLAGSSAEGSPMSSSQSLWRAWAERSPSTQPLELPPPRDLGRPLPDDLPLPLDQSLPMVRVSVVGNSFMLHQIRLMVGAAVMVARNMVSPLFLRACLSLPRAPRLPMAPPGTLVLREPIFAERSGIRMHGQNDNDDGNDDGEEADAEEDFSSSREQHHGGTISLVPGSQAEELTSTFFQDVLVPRMIEQSNCMLYWPRYAAHAKATVTRQRRVWGPASITWNPTASGNSQIPAPEEALSDLEVAMRTANRVPALLHVSREKQPTSTFPGFVMRNAAQPRAVQELVEHRWRLWQPAEQNRERALQERRWQSRVEAARALWDPADVQRLLEARGPPQWLVEPMAIRRADGSVETLQVSEVEARTGIAFRPELGWESEVVRAHPFPPLPLQVDARVLHVSNPAWALLPRGVDLLVRHLHGWVEDGDVADVLRGILVRQLEGEWPVLASSHDILERLQGEQQEELKVLGRLMRPRTSRRRRYRRSGGNRGRGVMHHGVNTNQTRVDSGVEL